MSDNQQKNPEKNPSNTADEATDDEQQRLLLEKHLKLLKMSLDMMPSDYAVFQTSRPTMLFFLLSSLDLLGQLDRCFDAEAKQRAIDWIYGLQLGGSGGQALTHQCGFLGAPPSSVGIDGQAKSQQLPTASPYECAHLAQTYTALGSLLILGDPLDRVDRDAVLAAVRCCQCEDGSFSATGDRQSECDMRFCFCAVAICYILDDFSCIDLPALCAFIRRSVSYDGGIGQGPGLESHGGSTFCAVASLALLGRLWDGNVLNSDQLERLKGWALRKQDKGFHGRTNKPDDSCYAFWLGATLTILNAQPLINWPALRSFLLRMQDRSIGGFCKFEESSHSDLLHTYFSLAAFGMFGEPHIRPICPALNISARAHEHLQRLKSSNSRKAPRKQ